jgi:hypothetical protein
MPITKHHKSKLALQHANAQEIVVRIGVEKSAYHHLSHFEIDGDNPCSRQVSNLTVLRTKEYRYAEIPCLEKTRALSERSE